MLTSKQRSYLRSLANKIEPIFQVGKGGITENVVKQFKDALEARELVKANILKNSVSDVREVCEELSGLTNSEVVQIIGSKFILYKESKENKTIELPGTRPIIKAVAKPVVKSGAKTSDKPYKKIFEKPERRINSRTVNVSAKKASDKKKRPN